MTSGEPVLDSCLVFFSYSYSSSVTATVVTNFHPESLCSGWMSLISSLFSTG